METLDEVADMLSKKGRGFVVVQYEAKDGKGVQYRYKAEDMETMLGFLIPIVDSICTEYVENEGYLVCESIRQTVEKTMMMNDTRPSDELFEKDIECLREIFANYKLEPEEDEEDDNPALTWDELRQMKGKPVWVENVFGLAEWHLIVTVRDDCVVTVSGLESSGSDIHKEDYPHRWQAYRKERE